MTHSPIKTALVALALVAVAGSAAAANGTLKEIENAFIEVGDKVRPCVVNIDVERSVPVGMPEMDIEGLERFFRFFGQPRPDSPFGQPPPDNGEEQRPRTRSLKASGSGFIYDKQGHIITNNHVVNKAETITVRLWNGETRDAKLVGTDPQTDLAVIKIEPDADLPAAQLGDSDTLRVGQFSVAVGSPQGLEGSLSFGHVTALGRGGDEIRLPSREIRFFDFIQTDAAINLGNSGGPLCNIDGEVIGINVAIVWRADALGFAIPINTARKIVPVLIAEGKITRGYLGVHIEDASQFTNADELPDGKGAYVTYVQPDTPAERSGIQTYDVIRKVNGQTVEDAANLQTRIADIPPGQAALLEVWRDGKAIEVEVKLDEFPEDMETALLGKDILGIRVRALAQDIVERLGLEPGTRGVIVVSLEQGSPAEHAGIQRGDIILEVAKQPVASAEEFTRVMKENAIPGKSVLVRVLRPSPDAPSIPSLIPIPVPEEGSGE